MGHHGVVSTDRATSSLQRRRRTASLAAIFVVVATGCVGSVDRDEFNRIVQERGGGLSQALVIDAVTALEDELGVDPLVVQSIVATNETVTIEAVSPQFPDEIDRFTFSDGDLSDPNPASALPDLSIPDISIPDITIPDLPPGVDLPPELADLIEGATPPTTAPADPASSAASFPVDTVSLELLDDLVDAAIETAALRGGYAKSVSITTVGGGGPRIQVSVTNDRTNETITYGPDGGPVGGP